MAGKKKTEVPAESITGTNETPAIPRAHKPEVGDIVQYERAGADYLLTVTSVTESFVEGRESIRCGGSHSAADFHKSLKLWRRTVPAEAEVREFKAQQS